MRMSLSKHLELCMLQHLLPRVIPPKDWGSQGICTPVPISHWLGATVSSPTGRILFTSTYKCGWAGKKKSAYNAGDLGLIPGLGRSPGEGKGYPLQYSGLENSMDCITHRIAKSWTQLSDFWRRQWHPTPALLPGKSHGWSSLVGCSPWIC